MKKSKEKPPFDAKALLTSFCKAWDAIHDCSTEYGCAATCPLRAFVECRMIQQGEGGTTRDAVKKYIHKVMSPEEAIRIIEQKFGLTMEQIQSIIKKEQEQ